MNILCFNGSEWLTPKMTPNILDGITKRTFSSIFKVKETELSLKDLKSMKMIIGSGTAAGVLPISKIDNLLFDTSEAFVICQEYKKQTLNNSSFFDEIKIKK